TGIMIIDVETHTIVDVNPIAAEIICASKEDIVGKTCHKFMCQAEKGKCPVTDLGQSIDNSECILVTTEGEEVPIIKTVIPTLLNGRMHIVDSFIDISDRKQAEQALQESEEKLRQLFNSVADMIVLIDTLGNILNVNDSVKTIFGLRADEVIGRNFAELGVINPDDLPEVAKLLADSVASKKTIQTVFEIRGIHKDGHEIPIEVVSSSTVGLENDEGKLKGMLATIR
ncbi:unnamed protein product, partial [marine sediment metagenome]